MTEKNYTIYHLHSDLSVLGAGIDSVAKFEDYIEKAKECGMSALGFSEHGAILGWLKKKESIEKAGMKYIHGIEAYLTESLDEKIRDNFHTVLIAKNYEGVKEINRLSSKSFNKEDNHFYYKPRISVDELLNTSDNVIITSACLASVLNKGSDELKEKYLDFFINNKERCFLEIQHHNDDQQKEFNKQLYEISKKTGLRLIAGTDTHALNDEQAEARILLQRSKHNRDSAYEDNFDLTFKTYDELVDAYRIQNALPEEVYLQAIENTNVMADMVEEFTVDRSHKYPHLWGNNSEKIFKEKILNGIKEKGIDKKPNAKEYCDRIKEEIATYKHNGAIDFMLLEEEYKAAMRKKGITCGYGRGSVSGSVIAYLLGITDIDSVAHKLNFSRFMNEERVSLADIDSDWYSEDRPVIKDYLYHKEGLYCSEIITFNTIKLKGALRDVARVMDEDLQRVLEKGEEVSEEVKKSRLNKVDSICKDLENHEQKYREQYPVLFHWADILTNAIVSVGSHPAGFILGPHPLDDVIGLCYTSESKYPVSQLNMKELDSLNYVKLK